MAEDTLSTRGKRKLVHENHVYVFSKRSKYDDDAIWVCEKRSSCKGRVWTRGMNGAVFKVVTHHNHAAQAARPEALRVVENVRTEVT